MIESATVMTEIEQEAEWEERRRRINESLRALYPELHKHLSEKYGQVLRDWLEHGPFDRCEISVPDLFIPSDELNVLVSPGEGYDGWYIPSSAVTANAASPAPDLKAYIEAEVRKLLLTFGACGAIDYLAQQLTSPSLSKEDRLDMTLLVSFVAEQNNQPKAVTVLWYFENKTDLWLDCELLIDDGVFDSEEKYLPRIWREIEGLLTPEARHLLA